MIVDKSVAFYRYKATQELDDVELLGPQAFHTLQPVMQRASCPMPFARQLRLIKLQRAGTSRHLSSHSKSVVHLPI